MSLGLPTSMRIGSSASFVPNTAVAAHTDAPKSQRSGSVSALISQQPHRESALCVTLGRA